MGEISAELPTWGNNRERKKWQGERREGARWGDGGCVVERQDGVVCAEGTRERCLKPESSGKPETPALPAPFYAGVHWGL